MLKKSLNLKKIFLGFATVVATLPLSQAFGSESSEKLEQIQKHIAELKDHQSKNNLDQRIKNLESQIATLTKTLETKKETLNPLEAKKNANFPDGFLAISDTAAVKIGGYVKLDIISDNVGSSPTNAASSTPTGRVNINNIPLNTVGNTAYRERSRQFALNAQQSRFNFTALNRFSNQKDLKAFIEFDFYGDDQVDALAPKPRLRHAYGEYAGWLIGKTFTNFWVLDMIGETVDLNGITGNGIIFTEQVRYTYDCGCLNLSASIEQPRNEYTKLSAGVEPVKKNNTLPIFVTNNHYKINGKHYIGFSAMFSKLDIEYSDNKHKKTNSYGAGIYGKVFLVNNTNAFASFYAGKGLGRYMNELADAKDKSLIVDKVNGIDEFYGLNSWHAYVGICHYWTENLRSTFILGKTRVDFPKKFKFNDANAVQINKKIDKAIINLIYSPVKKLDLGIEYYYISRENPVKNKGRGHRIQLAATYRF